MGHSATSQLHDWMLASSDCLCGGSHVLLHMALGVLAKIYWPQDKAVTECVQVAGFIFDKLYKQKCILEWTYLNPQVQRTH